MSCIGFGSVKRLRARTHTHTQPNHSFGHVQFGVLRAKTCLKIVNERAVPRNARNADQGLSLLFSPKGKAYFLIVVLEIGVRSLLRFRRCSDLNFRTGAHRSSGKPVFGLGIRREAADVLIARPTSGPGCAHPRSEPASRAQRCPANLHHTLARARQAQRRARAAQSKTNTSAAPHKHTHTQTYTSATGDKH